MPKLLIFTLVLLISTPAFSKLGEVGDINLEAELHSISCESVDIGYRGSLYPICAITLKELPGIKLIYDKAELSSKYPYYYHFYSGMVVLAKYCKNDYGEAIHKKLRKAFGVTNTFLRCWDIDSLSIKR